MFKHIWESLMKALRDTFDELDNGRFL